MGPLGLKSPDGSLGFLQEGRGGDLVSAPEQHDLLPGGTIGPKEMQRLLAGRKNLLSSKHEFPCFNCLLSLLLLQTCWSGMGRFRLGTSCLQVARWCAPQELQQTKRTSKITYWSNEGDQRMIHPWDVLKNPAATQCVWLLELNLLRSTEAVGLAHSADGWGRGKPDQQKNLTLCTKKECETVKKSCPEKAEELEVHRTWGWRRFRCCKRHLRLKLILKLMALERWESLARNCGIDHLAMAQKAKSNAFGQMTENSKFAFRCGLFWATSTSYIWWFSFCCFVRRDWSCSFEGPGLQRSRSSGRSLVTGTRSSRQTRCGRNSSASWFGHWTSCMTGETPCTPIITELYHCFLRRGASSTSLL